jgi:hypothetical protein
MKKRLFLLILLLIMATTVAFSMQLDTITGWNCPDDTDMNFNADIGLPGNLTYDLRAEDSSGATRTLTYVAGATTFAISAAEWDGGDSIKWWSAKFKANGYMNFKVYSKQSSDAGTPGPKYWKLQCRKSGGVWEDIVGANVTVAADWTTGVVNGLDLPVSMNNPGTTSVYIRWIMTSNDNINGGTVGATGTSKIDDILVTGENAAGIESILYKDGLSIYPNPANELLYFESAEVISKIEIYDMKGARVISKNEGSQQTQINISNLQPGLYFVKTYFTDQNKTTGRNIVVQ